MSTISQIRVEMHEKSGRKGTFYVGNINLPANIDLDNLIVFFYPPSETGGVAEILVEKWKDKNGSGDQGGQNLPSSQGTRR